MKFNINNLVLLMLCGCSLSPKHRDEITQACIQENPKNYMEMLDCGCKKLDQWYDKYPLYKGKEEQDRICQSNKQIAVDMDNKNITPAQAKLLMTNANAHQCYEMGAKPDTPEFLQCELQIQNNRAKIQAAAIQAEATRSAAIMQDEAARRATMNTDIFPSSPSEPIQISKPTFCSTYSLPGGNSNTICQ